MIFSLCRYYSKFAGWSVIYVQIALHRAAPIHQLPLFKRENQPLKVVR